MSDSREVPVACRANNFNFVGIARFDRLLDSVLAGGLEGKDARREADRQALMMHSRLWCGGRMGFLSPSDGLIDDSLQIALAAYDAASVRMNEEKVSALEQQAKQEAAQKAHAEALAKAAEEAKTNGADSNAQPEPTPGL